jgi:hypothetical protein
MNSKRSAKPFAAAKGCSLNMEEFDSNVQDKLDSVQYCAVSPDFASEAKQLKMIFDQNLLIKPQLPKIVLKKTFDYMTQILSYHNVYSNDVLITEVEYNPNGSCGYPINGYGNKGKLVTSGFLIHSYPAWRRDAHLYNYIVPFSVCGKKEILPVKKADDHNVRIFEFPHAYHYFYSAQDNQTFNKTFYQMDWLILVSKRYQYGGLDQLIQRMILRYGLNRKFVTGDVSKFDKSFLFYMKKMCRRLRTLLYKGYDHASYRGRMRYIYIQDTCAYLVLRNGQVIQILGSQLSGLYNTTSDNCLAHMFLLISYIVYNIERHLTFWDIMQMICGCIYADDNLLSFRIDLLFLVPFNTRAEFYKKFNWQLKLEDDAIQDSLVGLKLLGAEIQMYCGHYVPKYNEHRLWAGLILRRGDLNTEQEYGKAFALYILGAFCSEKYTNYAYQYCLFLHKRTFGKIDLPDDVKDDDLIGVLDGVELIMAHTVPKVEIIRKYFWIGFESLSGKNPIEHLIRMFTGKFGTLNTMSFMYHTLCF